MARVTKQQVETAKSALDRRFKKYEEKVFSGKLDSIIEARGKSIINVIGYLESLKVDAKRLLSTQQKAKLLTVALEVMKERGSLRSARSEQFLDLLPKSVTNKLLFPKKEFCEQRGHAISSLIQSFVKEEDIGKAKEKFRLENTMDMLRERFKECKDLEDFIKAMEHSSYYIVADFKRSAHECLRDPNYLPLDKLLDFAKQCTEDREIEALEEMSKKVKMPMAIRTSLFNIAFKSVEEESVVNQRSEARGKFIEAKEDILELLILEGVSLDLIEEKFDNFTESL